MNEIHKASTNPNGHQWKSAASHPLMGVWWGCWLIGSIATRAESRLIRNGIDLGTGGFVLSWASVLLIVRCRIDVDPDSSFDH